MALPLDRRKLGSHYKFSLRLPGPGWTLDTPLKLPGSMGTLDNSLQPPGSSGTLDGSLLSSGSWGTLCDSEPPLKGSPPPGSWGTLGSRPRSALPCLLPIVDIAGEWMGCLTEWLDMRWTFYSPTEFAHLSQNTMLMWGSICSVKLHDLTSWNTLAVKRHQIIDSVRMWSTRVLATWSWASRQ